MSVWLLQRPKRDDERRLRYFVAIDGQVVRTTSQALLARRFDAASEAQQFATLHGEHFDEWRVGRR